MDDTGIRLALSQHEMTTGIGYQRLEIELVSRDRIITPAALSGLALPTGIDPRKGVLISGRAPVWLYAYLVHECHPTLWVACFDPRLGAVVTSTHSAEVSVGSVISLETLNLSVPSIQPGPLSVQDSGEKGPGLLIVGPPDSGKSVLSHQIFSTLVKDYPDIYLQRAHWDGEGNWTLELPADATDEEREAYKLANKGGLTETFFPYQGEAILNLRRQKRLVIVDAGGMVQPEKKSILDACTHYLIISSKQEEIEPWHDFCLGEGGLEPVAVIHSVLEERCEVLKREPFLEMVCGPWVMGKTEGIPAVLKETIVQILR
ncbi:MAG: CRISPR-associated ring nuclease Crn3/Csx3 [Cyanobacteria bacterium J06648_10]